jgi:hypothetical protein
MRRTVEIMTRNYIDVQSLILVPCQMHSNGMFEQLAEGIFSPGAEPYGFHHILGVDEYGNSHQIATLSRSIFDEETAEAVVKLLAGSLSVSYTLKPKHYNAHHFML